MADEPRRSGRATKGQNTKDREIDGEGPKKKGRTKASKTKASQPADEDEEIIRCICGQYEEEEDTQRDMICCDECAAWQHNDCMLLPYPPEEAPDQYYCEKCKPGDHKLLLAAIARGEKPWEEVAKKREAAEAEKATKKKKGGKRGRKSASRPSEALSEASPEVDTTRTPSKGPAGKEAGSSSAGQKRKHEEPSNGADTAQDVKKPRPASDHTVATPVDTQNGAQPAVPQRKSSSVMTPARQDSRPELPQGMASNVGELSNQRKSIATSFVKLFSSEAATAQRQGKYVLPQGQTAEGIGTQLGLSVEHALYQILCHGSGDPNDAYKAQVRTILFNVKKNDALRDGLLDGTLTGQNLAKMSPEDMASKEQQLRDAKIKQEQEKQHVIVQEQGPRIRRTHKGEEYVDETQQVAAEPDMMNAPVRRRESGLGQDSEETSRSPATAAKAGGLTSADEKALSINTQARPMPGTKLERRSSQAFNIQDVWSSVQGSPDGDRPAFPQIPYQSGEQSQKTNQTEADADIDALLKDEGVESPPYSPKSFAGDKSVIWQGMVNMNPVARFQGSARKAAGAEVENLGLTWQELIPEVLTVEGRIDPARADSYLCGLRYSSTSDVVVISISAADTRNDRHQFGVLFNYFKTRNRYGVGVSSINPAIKDIYLIPLEAGSERKPELLQLLDNDEIETPIPEDILLVPFVIKTSELNAAATAAAGGGGGGAAAAAAAATTPRDHSTIGASPIGAANTPGGSVPPAIASMHSSGFPPSYPAPSTPNPAPSMHHTPQPPAPAPAPTPTQQINHTPPPPPPNLTGPEAVTYILGPQAAQLPALQQMLQQAPNVGIAELRVVAQCLEENAEAGRDLTVLTAMLVRRQEGAGFS